MADSCKCDATGPAKINGFHDVPKPFFIGVGGGTASGKSTVCSRITERLGQNEVDQSHKQVVIISIESFYKELSDEELEKAKKGQFNFDHPGAFDESSLLRTFQDIKAGKTVHVPVYDLKTFKRKDEIQIVPTVDVIILEGILVFYFKEVRDMFDMKLFVDTDPDTRLSRRVMRDMKEMGRELEQILYQYTTYVKPAFEDFCLPTKKYVDVIIPRGADNTVAVDLIVQHIQELLKPSKNGFVKRIRHNSDSLELLTRNPPGFIHRTICDIFSALIPMDGKILTFRPGSRPH